MEYEIVGPIKGWRVVTNAGVFVFPVEAKEWKALDKEFVFKYLPINSEIESCEQSLNGYFVRFRVLKTGETYQEWIYGDTKEKAINLFNMWFPEFTTRRDS